MGVSEDRTDRALLLTFVTCYAQAPVNGFENNSPVVPEEPAPVTALSGQHSPVPEPDSLVRLLHLQLCCLLKASER